MQAEMDSSARVTLAQLVATLGPGLLAPLKEAELDDVAVRRLVVFDPLDQQEPQAGDLILAIGVDPTHSEFTEILSDAEEAGAAAVVAKLPRNWADLQVAEGLSTRVLTVPAATPWTHLMRLLQQALDAAQTSGAVEPTDLFALANVIAWTVGGPVTIEDTANRVLAYSATSDDEIDEPRTNTILGRQVSERYLVNLRSRGVFRALQHSEGVVSVDADESIGLRRRLAVGVRAGEELLGYLWVAEGIEPLRDDAERALRDAARLAAVHFIRARNSVESAVQARQDLLRDLLDERVDSRVVAQEFGVEAGAPAAVLGVNLPAGLEAASGVGRRRRIAEMLLAYSSAYRWDIGVLDAGTHLMAVLFGLKADNQRVTAGMRRLGESLRDSASAAGNPVQVALGPVVPRISDLPRSSKTVDWMLRALRADVAVERRGHPRADAVVVDIDDIQALVTLERVSHVLSAHPDLHVGVVATLREIDQERGTDHLDTLAAWLEASGDIPRAAQQTDVHPNTFRYRLRSISRVTGLDLDDANERVVAALHLHLLDRGLLQTDGTVGTHAQPKGRAMNARPR